MFSSRHSLIREKKFILPTDKEARKRAHHLDGDTLTDNHLLFMMHRERTREAVQLPTARMKMRRFFGRQG
ncbi:MAG: hypothetical protein HKN23_06160 [Verrucomicrobiales bacterium]|nr:hypothetical protein [Verrucomicrobiales bacterium]